MKALDKMSDDERFMEMMRALSDPNRLTIMRTLKGNRMCSCQILRHVDVSQPTLSHHMSTLLEAGLVRTIPTGRWYDYEVDEGALEFMKSYIDERLRSRPLVPVHMHPTSISKISSRSSALGFVRMMLQVSATDLSSSSVTGTVVLRPLSLLGRPHSDDGRCGPTASGRTAGLPRSRRDSTQTSSRGPRGSVRAAPGT